METINYLYIPSWPSVVFAVTDKLPLDCVVYYKILQSSDIRTEQKLKKIQPGNSRRGNCQLSIYVFIDFSRFCCD